MSKEKILKIIKDNETIISIGLLSLITLIIGTLAIDFFIAFAIVFTIDIALIITNKFNKNKDVTTKMTKKDINKSEIKKEKVKKVKPKKEPKEPKTKKNKFKEIFKVLLIIGFIMAIIVLITGIAFLGYIIKNAPEFTSTKLYNKEASFLYTADGEEFAKLGTEMRQKITYEELSESLIDAIIATEDSRYFQHSGVDLPRFLKASISQVLGKGGGGASTLTMQVSKNAFTSTEDEGIEGIIRKFSDIYISVFKIETHYTKEQILEFYVNSNYLGGGAYGVEQASLNYFGKSAKELNVAESAMIAGLFQAPHGYDPYIYPDDCEDRRQTVLYLMLRHGYINQEEYDIAKELTVQKLLIPKEDTDEDEYQAFINTVVEEVYERTGYDPYEVPMKIYTTMNTKMQDNMNNVMNGVSYKWKDDYAQAASIVLDVDTGAVVAVGSGRNVVAKGYNIATKMKKQIGSTAKPLYDYGPAIEYNNWSTYTPLADEPYKYTSGMNLKNWDSKFENFNTLQEALKHSRNIPALKAFQSVKNSNIKKFVTNLGLSPELDETGHIHEAHSLGGYNGESPLTVAAAYAAFSNGGYYIEPHSFTLIEFTDTGDVFEVKPIKRKAMSAETAYMVAKMLEDTSSYAIGLSVNGVNYAAKSGTTNLSSATIKEWKLPSNAISDKWIASFNQDYSIAVWYGYEQLSSDYYLTTNDYSIKRVFQAIAKGVYTKKSTWKKPSGVVEVKVEDELPEAMIAGENAPDELKITAYFKKGFEPTSTSSRFNTLSNVTNLNYNEATNTLTWDNIATPNFFNAEYLKNMYDSMFKDDKALENQVNAILEYNNTEIGNIIYDIYVKDSNGNLVYINSTDSNSYVYPITDTTTFVVKTNYSIYKKCESKGSEFTITKIPKVITSSLNSESSINIKVGDLYQEPEKPVIVLENGLTDITNLANISVLVTKTSNGQTFNSANNIDTSVADTYTISYTINYENYSNTLTKTIYITQ